MRLQSVSRVGVGAALGLMLAVTASGCASAAEGEDAPADSESALSEKYDVHQLVNDDEVRGGGALTTARIQEFLARKGSYLATYSEGGRSAATIIHDSCSHWNINPIYMLARIQIESSLVSSGTSRSLKSATGCACPDNSRCDRNSAGFAQQVECAANLHATYFDEMDRTGVTRAEWGVGKTMRTLDPCSVTPRNKATAAIYTYTPWVGPLGKQCSSRGSSGSTTMISILKSYQRELTSSPP